MSDVFIDWSDDEEQPHMDRQYRPDPAQALRELALETQPPSRLDIGKAARDGLRLRRRRRVARSLTGVATASVVATAGVLPRRPAARAWQTGPMRATRSPRPP